MTIETLIAFLQQLLADDVDAQLLRRGLAMGLEPMTAFTDAILAAWTMFLAGLLFARAPGGRPVPVRLWGWAFVAATISSLAGVAYHGFRTYFYLPIAMTQSTWTVVPVATGIAALCLGSAGALVWLPPKHQRFAFAALGIEFIACVVAAARHDEFGNSFGLVGADYLPVLIALLIGSLMHWRRPAAGFIAAGILTSFVAIGIQLLHWQYHNDVYHLVQMIAMYLLYRGGAQLAERETAFAAELVPAN